MRPTTISAALLFCFSSFIAFLPLYLVGQFGFNFYLNGIILNLSEILIFPIVLYFINSLPRKKFLIYCYIAILILSLPLIILNQSNIHINGFGDPRLLVVLACFFLVRAIITMEI